MGGTGGDWETDPFHSDETHYVSCSWCMGSGHQTCSNCDGSGTETCSTCEGQGVLTRIGTPVLVVDPTYRLAQCEPNDQDVVHAIESYATLTQVGNGWEIGRA